MTVWERTTSRGTRRYSHISETEAEAIAFARKKDKTGALVRVYEREGDTDAPFTDERGIHHANGCHKSKLRCVTWWK